MAVKEMPINIGIDKFNFVIQALSLLGTVDGNIDPKLKLHLNFQLLFVRSAFSAWHTTTLIKCVLMLFISCWWLLFTSNFPLD